VATDAVHVDPDTKITDLIGRLTDDSKRLLNDEVRLAKLETSESIHIASRGALWLALAFGIGIVAMVAFTILLTTLIGRLIGEMWAGALIAGALELGVGFWLLKRGTNTLAHNSYTLGESREELRRTAAWLSSERAS
jgi:Putative Actinobacterial Holin-X, holin superfamily III